MITDWIRTDAPSLRRGSAVFAAGLLLGLASLAYAEVPNGSDAEAVVADWSEVDARLTALLDELPEQAHAGIRQALDANRDGRQRALEALAEPGEDAQREARARDALADAYRRSEGGLDTAIEHVPEAARARIADARERMAAGLARAGVAMDARGPAAAGDRRPAAPGPDAASARPVERPAVASARPERPDVTARPQRPEPARRPSGPMRPDVPRGR